MNTDLISIALVDSGDQEFTTMHRTLRSIASCEWPRVEVILSVAASARHDLIDQVRRVHERPGLTFMSVHSSVGSGHAAAIEVMKGRYLHVLGPEIEVTPCAYSRLATALESHSTGVAVGGTIQEGSKPEHAGDAVGPREGTVTGDRCFHPLHSLLIDLQRVRDLPKWDAELGPDAVYYFYLGLRAAAKFDYSLSHTPLFVRREVLSAVHPAHSQEMLSAIKNRFPSYS